MIKSVVANFILDNKVSFLFLYGETGSGKTTAARELINGAEQFDIKNYIAYLHTPVPCKFRSLYQQILKSMNVLSVYKRTNFELNKILEHTITAIREENGNTPVFILDDASNILYSNDCQKIIEGFKQLAEVTKVKFVLISNHDLSQSVPTHIVRRSNSVELISA